MSSTSSSAKPFPVVIAGGGVGALEAGLALRELGADRFRITMIAPDPEFVYRPMTVREPFAAAPARRYPIAELAAEIDAELIVERLAWLEPEISAAHTTGGGNIRYDAMILALGAQPVPRHDHAVTIDDRRLDEQLHGLIQDVEGGYVHDLAFVIPPGMAWPLPVYELALLTARRAFDMSVKLDVTIITPESAPLAIFGETGSATVAELLAANAITTMTSASCEVPDGRHVVVTPGDRRLAVDRVIALPELYGPSLRGLPAGEHGFIPIDPQCRVRGVEDVYAAGDATESPLKFGGLAAQQADTAAQTIAASAGLPFEAAALHPVVHATLLTGGDPLRLSARIVGGQGFSTLTTESPGELPSAKIAARYLAPYLEAQDRLAGAAR
jgi:sulfide:quinone oxidoreductase